jgi:hypothetical protein
LFENGGLADPSLPVEHQDVIDVFPRQAALNPIEDVLAAKKHTGFDDGCSSDIGIENIVH